MPPLRRRHSSRRSAASPSQSGSLVTGYEKSDTTENPASANAADAEIKGVEADFTFAPYSAPGLTVAGAFSILDTEITEVLIPTNDGTTKDSKAANKPPSGSDGEEPKSIHRKRTLTNMPPNM